jgi:hypothetical protein
MGGRRSTFPDKGDVFPGESGESGESGSLKTMPDYAIKNLFIDSSWRSGEVLFSRVGL